VQELPIAVDASGNVLIGAGTPFYKFAVTDNVNGNVVSQIANAAGGASANAISQLWVGGRYVNYIVNYSSQYVVAIGYGIVISYADFDTHIWRNNAGAERMRIDTNGNVGIGTSAPLGSAGFGWLTLNGTAGSIVSHVANGTETLRVQAEPGFVDLNVRTNVPFIFKTSDTERARITGAGNVGIGTSSPSVKLDVVGAVQSFASSGFPAFSTSSCQAAGYAPGLMQMTRANASGGATPDNSVIGSLRFDGRDTTNAYALFGAIEVNTGINASGGAPAFMAFSTSSSGASVTERMRIDATGNVGIGTSSPSYSRLHLLGSGVTQGLKVESTSTTQFDGAAIYVRGAAGTTRSTGFIHINTNVGGTSSAFNINSYGATDNYLSTLASYEYSSNQWIFYTNSAERMRIDAAGKVGIGTSSPDASSALDVTSTTGGVLFPRMTGTQRDAIGSPANGLVLYNTTTNKLQVRAAGAWVDLH
jgi:hypothetical protein